MSVSALCLFNLLARVAHSYLIHSATEQRRVTDKSDDIDDVKDDDDSDVTTTVWDKRGSWSGCWRHAAGRAASG